MKILHGQQLVNELRKLSDNVKNRIWISAPYIGNPNSIGKILGKRWFDSPSINIKLLTDVSDLSCIDTQTLQLFHNRGQVKTLLGLHAKIYIIDNTCLITSANLTSTAFSKRYEIGIICNSNQSKLTIDIFEEWWSKSKNIDPDKLNKIFKSKIDSNEEIGITLPKLNDLPHYPGRFIQNLGKSFLNYPRLLEDYRDFATKYASIQRIWNKQPLNFEVDGFLDYLYHGDMSPSKKYETTLPRNLSTTEQLKQIKEWSLSFKVWAKDRDNNEWRLNNSKFIRNKLSPSKIKKLSKDEVRDVLLNTNAGISRRGNCNTVIKENKLNDVLNSLDILVNAHNLELPERFNRCNEIKGIGPSMMNELLGFCYPEKYPLINKNSNCGLRFFGYQIKAYN